MCGIVGAISLNRNVHPMDRKDYMLDAMIAGTLRGPHSTGIYAVNFKNELEAFKHTAWGPDFIQLREPKRILESLHNYKVVVGHHRTKTTGTIERLDAHPHVVDHICLVHNGTIGNTHELPSTAWDSKMPTVDTFKLTYSMARAGEKETLEAARGGYALVWWNAKDNTINLARNKEKPLALCWGEDKQVLWIASEWSMLGWILHRNNIKQTGKIWTLKEHVHHKISLTMDGINVEHIAYTPKAPKNYGVSRMTDHWPHQRDADEANFCGVQDRPHLPHGITPGARNESELLPHLPAVQRHREEQAKPANGTAKAEVLEGEVPGDSEEALSNNRIKKLNKALRKINSGFSYKGIVWGVPVVWSPYLPNDPKDLRGFGSLRGLHQDIVIQVHQITEAAWKQITKSHFIVPVRVTQLNRSVVGGDPILCGYVDAAQRGNSWGVILDISENDDTMKFIPYKPGEFLTKKQFHEKVKGKCIHCKQSVAIFEADEMKWIEDMPVCSDCAPMLRTNII